eukprot:6190125-Amphidinium_carterae.1
MKKPWRVVSDHPGLLKALTGLKCSSKHTHEQCRGTRAANSGRYTATLADIIMSGIACEGEACNAMKGVGIGSKNKRE